MINELAAAAGVEMEAGGVGWNVRGTGMKRKAARRCWPADAGRGGADRRKSEICSVKKNAERVVGRLTPEWKTLAVVRYGGSVKK